MTSLSKHSLLSTLLQPRYVVHSHAAPQTVNSSPWGGAYGPSWMGGAGGWRSALASANGRSPSGLQSTGAPGAATGWIGAPSWSNSNAKWRNYYSGLEQQSGALTTTAYAPGLSPKFAKDLNKALGKQLSRELKDVRRFVKHLY